MKKQLLECIRHSGVNVKASTVLMGLGQLMYGQIGKGLLYLLFLILWIVYFISCGANDFIGFFTLGTNLSNKWMGIEGDNSVIMLLRGIIAWGMIVLLICCYIGNIKDAYRTQLMVEKGKKPSTFREDMRQMLDKKFYKTVLFIPITGVLVFSITPIIFMILIAFTNYGGKIIPPGKLVDWIGLRNFKELASLSQFAPTFLKILEWNIVWAVVSTFINYFAGLGLALLLNKSCVKGKVFWRAFPILAYAIPGFITLIAFRFMFSVGGPVNYYLKFFGIGPISFFGIDDKWKARIIGFIVNAWISTPSIMLLSTGLLTNVNTELIEAAKIDGAGRWKQFSKIVLPFMIFSTTPVLLTQFIGNFNNFGIFFFLRGGINSAGYTLANDTSLLINWLYSMSIDNNYYCTGAVISLIMFLITSSISLLLYVRSSAYKEEDMYR